MISQITVQERILNPDIDPMSTMAVTVLFTAMRLVTLVVMWKVLLP